MNNEVTKGINVEGMKKLGLDLNEYAQEFKKIKNSIQIINSRLRKSMSGDLADNYINSLETVCENFDYIYDNIKNYSNSCYQIIQSYEQYDETTII